MLKVVRATLFKRFADEPPATGTKPAVKVLVRGLIRLFIEGLGFTFVGDSARSLLRDLACLLFEPWSGLNTGDRCVLVSTLPVRQYRYICQNTTKLEEGIE